MYAGLIANLALMVLAGFVGFAVISKVPNTLHTPLMSGTNAIHGIVLLGGLVTLGSLRQPVSWQLYAILFVATLFGAINVVGGFVVTDRMLGMFKAKPAAKAEPSAKPTKQIESASTATGPAGGGTGAPVAAEDPTEGKR